MNTCINLINYHLLVDLIVFLRTVYLVFGYFLAQLESAHSKVNQCTYNKMSMNNIFYTLSPILGTNFDRTNCFACTFKNSQLLQSPFWKTATIMKRKWNEKTCYICAVRHFHKVPSYQMANYLVKAFGINCIKHTN